MAIVAVFTVAVTFITEVTSNIATSTVFVPICLALANKLRLHPLLLALPTTLATSFAFMLPVATPPNAIVYNTGFVTIGEMVRATKSINHAVNTIITICRCSSASA